MPIAQPFIWKEFSQLKTKLFSVSCDDFRYDGFIRLFAHGSFCSCNSSRIRNVGVKGFNINCYMACFFWNIIDGFYLIENVFFCLLHKVEFQLQLVVQVKFINSDTFDVGVFIELATSPPELPGLWILSAV